MVSINTMKYPSARPNSTRFDAVATPTAVRGSVKGQDEIGMVSDFTRGAGRATRADDEAIGNADTLVCFRSRWPLPLTRSPEVRSRGYAAPGHFLAVVEAGSMSVAAADLGYAQSSVSEQIRRLEREFGVDLLVRSHSGITPTPSGQRLVEHARHIVADVVRAREAVSRAAQTLQIGALDTLAAEWLPDVLRAHEQRSGAAHPVSVTTRNRMGLLNGLRNADLDVAFVYGSSTLTSEQPRGVDGRDGHSARGGRS